jgi:non-homologous end joining protein Ku
MTYEVRIKDCAVRKSKKNPDVLTKVQLVDMAYEKFEIKKYKSHRMRKAALCNLIDKRLQEAEDKFYEANDKLTNVINKMKALKESIRAKK